MASKKLQKALENIVETSRFLSPELKKNYFDTLQHTGETFLAKQKKLNERIEKNNEKSSQSKSIVSYLREELSNELYDKDFITREKLYQIAVKEFSDITRGAVLEIANNNTQEIGITPLSDNGQSSCFYKDEFKNLILKYANNLLKENDFFVYSDIYKKLGLGADARTPLSSILGKLTGEGKLKITEPRPGQRIYTKKC